VGCNCRGACTNRVSIPWREFGDSDRLRTASRAWPCRRVSIPWREFGDSDGYHCQRRERLPLGFNSLAGVRGFGPQLLQGALHLQRVEFQFPGGSSGIRTDSPANQSPCSQPTVSIPWREFGDSDFDSTYTQQDAEMGFNSLAGVRGFGLMATQRPSSDVIPFQFPGGSSGIRTNAGKLRRCAAGCVSIPWREFGDSDFGSARIATRPRSWVSIPWRECCRIRRVRGEREICR
jgi:hypothetical protein